jgi:hypothetical protein
MNTVFFLLAALSSLPVHAAPSKSAPATIEGFYRKYLGTAHKEKLSLPFSKSFRALQKEDAAACNKFAKGDICGFGADGDVYLDAQDYDPKLTYAGAGFKATEADQGKVTATFNLFPSDKTQGDANKRTIVFVMVKEKGAWAVDDILTRGESSRKQLRDEISNIQKTK